MLTKQEQELLPKIVNNNFYLFLILPNGSFYVWGGYPTTDSSATLQLKKLPIKIEFISDFACHFSNYIIDKTGKLYGCNNTASFLPNQDDNNKLELKEVPNIKNVDSMKVLTYASFFKTKDGKLFVSERDDPIPKIFYTNPNNGIQQIAAGNKHLVCFTQKHSVLCYGNSEDGQLGLGDLAFTTSFHELKIVKEAGSKNNEVLEIIKIACGYYHTLFLAKDKNNKHEVYCCGHNEFGQLGLGNFNNQYHPVSIRFFNGG